MSSKWQHNLFFKFGYIRFRGKWAMKKVYRESSRRNQTELAWALWKNGWNKLNQKSGKGRNSFRTYEERKTEKVLGWGGERDYEERLVYQWCPSKWRCCCSKVVDPGYLELWKTLPLRSYREIEARFTNYTVHHSSDCRIIQLICYTQKLLKQRLIADM